MRIPPQLRKCLVLLLALTAGAAAQNGVVVRDGPPDKLAFIFQRVIESELTQFALLRPGPLGNAVLALNPAEVGSLVANQSSINPALAAQLSNLPIPSAGWGEFSVYNKDLETREYYEQSLGPVFTERSQTVGKGIFLFATTFQQFRFDQHDDLDLREGFPVVVDLDKVFGRVTGGRLQGFNQSVNTIDLTISQTTAHFTFGLTDWMDFSYALPFVRSSLDFGTAGNTQFVPGAFVRPEESRTPQRSVSASGTASGLGDGVARIKAEIASTKDFGIAVAADIRLPTGDELNYLGTGGYGFKPFLVFDGRYKKLSPHVNLGYQWNGRSALVPVEPGSEDANKGHQRGQLPDQLLFAAGFDSRITDNITVVVDFIDQAILDTRRAVLVGSGVDPFPRTFKVRDTRETIHEWSAAIGLKAKLNSRLILSGNVLMRLNNQGLRSRVVPLVGVSYVVDPNPR